MEPAARQFLEHAWRACQRYDREGTCTLPFDAWPSILDDMGLDDQGEGCRFLMDHLSAAGDGFFTYEPLLQALGVPPPGQQSRQPDPGVASPRENSSADYESAPLPQRDQPPSMAGPQDAHDGYSARYDQQSSMPPPSGAGSYAGSYAGFDQQAPMPPPSGAGSYMGGARPPSSAAGPYGGGDGPPSSAGPPCGGPVGPPSAAGQSYGMGGCGGCSDAYGGGPSYAASRSDSYGGGGCGNGYNGAPASPPMSPPASAAGGCSGVDRGAYGGPPASYAGEGRVGPGVAQHHMMPGYGAAPSDCGQQSICPSDALEEVNEAFWARRAMSIQQLFTRWDCNQLSNDAFMARLQEVLGEAVDVTSPDSAFVLLANKHRSARNMKFAQLMSALRRDAQATSTKKFGRPLTSTGLSSYAGSYAPSNYEPSEAGSTMPMHAAGQRTGSGAPQQEQVLNIGGRRHYAYSESSMSGAVPRSSPAAPARLDGVDERGPAGFPPSGPQSPQGSIAGGSMAGGSMAGGPDPYYRSQASPAHRLGPARQHGVSDHSDVYSVAAPSESASIADSQRAEHANRNRMGHGNILTWGSNESRSVTPHRLRQRY